jgi:putative endonuclease
MATHNEIGKKGEEIAKEYLGSNQYTILHQNYRITPYEFDFICRNKKNQLIFVEVKTLQGIGYPEEMVTKSKERFLTEGAIKFKEKNELNEEHFFEIIAINLFKDNTHKIHHIYDAFF